MNVLMRSYTSGRTGANTEETVLTPARVGSNLLVKRFSLKLNDDPRLEAQPLFVSGVSIAKAPPRDVAYVCTMANNVWAFDAATGKEVWPKPVNLGRPIVPIPNANGGTEIELFHINVHWGILSTPVIDLDTQTMYIVCWTSHDGSVANAQFQLHALDITTGNQLNPPLTIAANAAAQGALNVLFRPSRQKQRASLALTLTRDAAGAQHKTLFAAFSITHEEGDPQTHGWIIAFDVQAFRQTAAWCTTPHGGGCGIWQAGAGIAADDAGDVYVMTGNYGVGGPPAAGDLPESFVKLHYTPPAAAGAQARLEPVAWFMPFHDADRNPAGDDDFRDYDLGSAGPVLIPDFGFVVGAGKDGVLFVLDQDTTRLGQGQNFAVLKKPPLFYTYFPGFGIDASHVQNLDHLFDGKTHHLHTSSVYWHNPTLGPMLFCWGENECLRAWKIDGSGQATFFAKSAEIASAGAGGRGGMPGGILSLSANGNQPNTGIVWALAPISGDANKHIVAGILRAYDATNLDPVPNADGTPRLKLLWDSTHIPGNAFDFCKFCPPVIANGQVYAPTYDGRIDVYGLIGVAPGPIATNAIPIHVIKRMQKEP